ncbi:hypothetical protein FB567DRAFT_603441 [Paraphoma chrysanthemicola]|uniref:MFS general substrate transporter n=1 Tax=Paraphoma chrysanthemicola TaxID=798071 RepID=A0A8K0R5U5_9PLEO|nr:hypothetical protein FB567DRAFT_603441 [Paraphoma chrysanthemicola]
MGLSADAIPPTTLNVTANPEARKVAPRTITRKLPWLDGRGAQNATTTPSQPLGSDTKSPSPTTHLSSHRPSAAPAIKRATTTTPVVRRKSLIAAIDRGDFSVAGSSPSPITRYQLSQTRRVSVASKGPSPLRSATSHPSATHEPRKRLSIVKHHQNDLTQMDHSDVRPRAESLAPVADHLERSITPDSIRAAVRRDVVSSTSPAIVSRVQMSPSQPAPGRTAFERIGDRRISNAIEGLEDMVQEAVEMAGETEDQRQVEEIYDIVEDARAAIYDASEDPSRHLVATTSPLVVSDSSGDEVVSDFSSQSSYGGHDEHRGVPRPGQTPPSPPVLIQRNIVDHAKNTAGRGMHNELQRDSASFDWAYPRRGQRAQSRSSTSSSSNPERVRRSYSTQSDLLLLPQPIQSAPRDHVDFVLRPIARDQSRGRSRRRPHEDGTMCVCRHRHRHNPDRMSRSRSLRRQHRSSGFSQIDTSFDEEDIPAKMYGNALTVREQAHHHTFSLRRHHRRQPIARNWSTSKKRLTAVTACINTALLGIIVGIYAGEVPRIQYFLADERHIVVVGNAVLYFGLALSTLVVWPLPLLHGRKPYLLAALALALPLQFPQAIVVSQKRSPNDARFRTGLLCARTATGLVLGFANVNYITVLLDLFGASLQSKNPHQEYVVPNDVRRHGGGMGMWLGVWSWCWIASLAVGFQVGAAIIEQLSPDWGFYVVVIILAFALVLNIMAPETRRAAYRKSVTEVYDRDENYITRRVSRGECKLHISTEGPKYWFEEVWAGLKLVLMMMCQPGFFVLSFYLAWIYAQIVLVIVLLGALLSRDYKWQPRYVGAGVMSIAIGAFLAIPLTKAGIFSRERKSAFRTDSMTFQKQVTWSSHLVRRAIFTLTLPLMGLAYTVSAAGAPKPYMVPIVFAGALGFLSILAIAECHGIMMETFDTCDLQPGVNTRHRLESMAVQDRRRRTNYTSFPRITAGMFVSQAIAFVLAGVATLVGGSMTRRFGAQASTGVTAGILLGLTILLTLVLLRFKEVQVIPNHTFGTRRDTAAWAEFKDLEKIGRGADWKAVVIGNPSGKMRRMSVLELGSLSRWTEIRKLNFLLKGPRHGEDTKKRRGFRDSW